MKKREVAKLFLFHAVSDEYLNEFESIVGQNERTDITFSTLINLIKERYAPYSNKVKNHCLFHRIIQQSNETFDDFVYHKKTIAEHYDSICDNEQDTVKDILIRDQILFGTNRAKESRVD